MKGRGGWRVGACVAVLSAQPDGAGRVASTEGGCALRKVVNMGQVTLDLRVTKEHGCGHTGEGDREPGKRE